MRAFKIPLSALRFIVSMVRLDFYNYYPLPSCLPPCTIPPSEISMANNSAQTSFAFGGRTQPAPKNVNYR
ncbi:hypothetical protein SBV1_1960006 [Verrucomicrobia bacterium]|nr:hypothetical protein SBV1_1960006 [Verrucomicrobiota bacterium]